MIVNCLQLSKMMNIQVHVHCVYIHVDSNSIMYWTWFCRASINTSKISSLSSSHAVVRGFQPSTVQLGSTPDWINVFTLETSPLTIDVNKSCSVVLGVIIFFFCLLLSMKSKSIFSVNPERVHIDLEMCTNIQWTIMEHLKTFDTVFIIFAHTCTVMRMGYTCTCMSV